VNFRDIGRRIDFGRNFDRFPFTPPLVASFGPSVTSLHWPVQDLGTKRRGSLPARAACSTVRCAQRVPHIVVEEVSESTRGTVTTGGIGCT
jgi:hypothetical protein